jgi:hypothetical protein
LPQGFEEDDADCGGEIQAANVGLASESSGNCSSLRAADLRKTARFAAKDETVFGSKLQSV